MAYLVSHIAICLIFAQLLGLLLGWLFWGYAARQRGKEVQTLRERLADMNFLSAARMAVADPRMALSNAPDTGALTSLLTGSDLPGRPTARRAFFEETPETAPDSNQPTPVAELILKAPPIAPDLEAEVRESKLQHLQQQVRELEGIRDRLPLLHAELTDAVEGRKAAEARVQEARNDFEIRSSNLLSQIADFESAAADWDKTRQEFEREKLIQQKELAAVKATLRDLQNSQRPQTADAGPPSASAVELADLRERYQKAVRERDAAAAELVFLKQSGNIGSSDNERLVDLEEAVRSRDAQLSEQAARVESLLWRVAELEPFAAEAPHKEESLRRQESEIAGHMAMHQENAERIRSLQGRVEELESTTIASGQVQIEVQRIEAEHQVALQSLLTEHQQRVRELEQALAMKDDEISEHVSARHEQGDVLDGMRARVADLETAEQQGKDLAESLRERDHDHQAQMGRLQLEWQQSLAAKDAEISEHISARAGQAAMIESFRARVAELETANQRIGVLEQSLGERENEIRLLVARNAETLRDVEALRIEAAEWKARSVASESQLISLQQRVDSLSSSLAAHEQRLLEQEQEAREQIKSVEDRHQTELTRMKINSAQRVRRFRQSINFKP